MPPYIFFHGAASLAPWSELEQGHICMATCIFTSAGNTTNAEKKSRHNLGYLQAQGHIIAIICPWDRLYSSYHYHMSLMDLHSVPIP